MAGHYLDKGFNVKFIYRPKYAKNVNFAVGLDDFAGTGLFTKEYIVSTTQLDNIKLSVGMGWGKFVGENSFKNPLSKISNKLRYRQETSDNISQGGTPSYDLWFRGNASIFGGLEYTIPNTNGIKLKVEHDPLNYFDFSANNRRDAIKELRSKDSSLNYGFSFPVNKYLSLEVSRIKGNTLNLSFNFNLKLGEELYKKPKFEPKISKINKEKQSEKVFYEELLNNLNNNNLLLQTASVENNKLDISISTSQHRNAIRSSSYAAFIANETANLNSIDLSQINISHINAGVELNNITYIANHFEDIEKTPIEVKKYYTKIDSGDPQGYKNDEFQPLVKFPVIFSTLKPALISHIGVPEKFYSGAITLQHISEIQFNRNFLLSSEINYSLYNNIENTLSGPASRMEHVRTDLVDYLKKEDFFITRLQLDYVWSPRKNLYTKISGGLFETMYGGLGGEFLYKPFNSDFSFGGEIFYVNQRTFDQMFKFREYETTTGHLNIGYMLPLGIESIFSFGRYLAKDDGYTLDLSRRTPSGFKAGIYFTRTNVSAEIFGEGSFDKGFYFQIPLDLLSRGYEGSYTNFKLSPLTRDGGARLMHEKNLRGLIYNSSYNDFINQWNGFLR